MLFTLLPLLLMQVAGAAITDAPLPVMRCDPACRSAPDAMAAADAARGDPGEQALYRFIVASVGTPGRIIYLNSDADYRAAGNVSAALSPRASEQLRTMLAGKAPANALVGQTIVVRGRPQRITIGVFDDNRRPTGEGYFQVRINVSRIDQIGLADASDAVVPPT